MKKFAFVLFYLIFINISCLFAQKVVMRHSNGVTIPYTSGVNAFVDAYDASVAGDTIYVPGGFFNAVDINKPKLVILGAGHYPDSTQATGQTILTGGFTFMEIADSVSFSGFVINGNVYFAYNNSVDYVLFYRNKVNGDIIFNGDGQRLNSCDYVTVKENIFNAINGTNALNCIVANNIINSRAENFETSSIVNNIFLGNYYYGWPYYFNYNISHTNICLIQNNIHYQNIGGFPYCNNNTIQNNLYISSPNFGTNTYSGNYTNVPQENIFINHSGNTFDYSYNYHLQNPNTYLGVDGTQVGIYGGIHGPYKEGAVPKNPHIIFKNIAPTTDNNGNLNVIIRVGAQNQ